MRVANTALGFVQGRVMPQGTASLAAHAGSCSAEFHLALPFNGNPIQLHVMRQTAAGASLGTDQGKERVPKLHAGSGAFHIDSCRTL